MSEPDSTATANRPQPRVVKGMPSVELTRTEFERRFKERHYDPAFDAVAGELDAVIDVAWKNYIEYHKSPRRRKAGDGFAEPDYELPIEWLATRDAIRAAERQQQDPASAPRVLLINGSARTDQSCPGEMSKSYRLALLAKEAIEQDAAFEVDRAKPAYRPRSRSAIGRAHAIRTMRSAKRRTG
jgi:hypothetical protein